MKRAKLSELDTMLMIAEREQRALVRRVALPLSRRYRHKGIESLRPDETGHPLPIVEARR